MFRDSYGTELQPTPRRLAKSMAKPSGRELRMRVDPLAQSFQVDPHLARRLVSRFRIAVHRFEMIRFKDR